MTPLLFTEVVLGGTLGISFQIMGKVATLKSKFPNESIGGIYKHYFKEEWNVLIVSFLVNTMCLIYFWIGDGLFFEEQIGPDYKNQVIFFTMVVIGYAAQRLVYAFLGTAEKTLSKKISDKEPKQDA